MKKKLNPYLSGRCKLILVIFTVLLTIGICSFQPPKNNPWRFIPNRSFSVGEQIEYRVHYGMMTAGEATMRIDKDLYYFHNRPCYKIEVLGKSVGVFDMILRIRDVWGTYVDTTALLPHSFYRKIEEGKYRKHEITNFDHAKDIAHVIEYNYKTKKVKKTTDYPVPNNVQDMVSGYYYMRTINFKDLKPGALISLPGFFEDKAYELKVRFLGRETLKTKVGNIQSIVISPIMPENSLFKGENSIKAWLSDDSNKIPLKIQAELFVGAVEIDIKSFKNARN